MLELRIEPLEMFDEETQTFVYTKGANLKLEHSLVSVAKWESKWNIPFLQKGDKTTEQVIDYVRCMTITPNVDPDVYLGLSRDNIKEIMEYIDAPMTATVINSTSNKGRSNRVDTAEVIYYYMTALNIPFECQKWHLNRLLMLINVCSIKSNPSSKMSLKERYKQNGDLNAQRKAMYNTSG